KDRPFALTYSAPRSFAIFHSHREHHVGCQSEPDWSLPAAVFPEGVRFRLKPDRCREHRPSSTFAGHPSLRTLSPGPAETKGQDDRLNRGPKCLLWSGMFRPETFADQPHSSRLMRAGLGHRSRKHYVLP